MKPSRLSFIRLENRITPSLSSRDGLVIYDDGQFTEPFGPTFPMANNTAGYDNIYVVGAAPGGGPRFQIQQHVPGSKDTTVLADEYGYELAFHGGVNVATNGKYVVLGAESDGGPVVAVYDLKGEQIGRFFSYDPSFNGGVSVQIDSNNVIYTTPGKGGGPVVAKFDVHGTPLGAFYGAPSSGRTGYSVILGKDPVGADTVNLVQPDGTVWVNYVGVGQYQSRLPVGYTQAGYSANAFTLGGNGYSTGYAVDLAFNELAPLGFEDHAAGNPNPPATTGFKQGIYNSSPLSGVKTQSLTSTNITKLTNLSGESVGAKEVGTGTLYLPMTDANGTVYAVTAAHVTENGSYKLITPGPADGKTQIVYGLPTIWSDYRGDENRNYSVDASAVPTTQPLKSAVFFNGVYYPIEGVAVPKIGDELIAVGRGTQPGVGVFQGAQVGSVNVYNGYLGGANLSGQYVVGPSIFGPLAIPGFSGGPVFSLKVDESGVHRFLVGMVIAGNGDTTYVTPPQTIADKLVLHYVFN